jgi:hypothetical protein
MDLRYTVHADRVKEEIVLADRTARSDIAFNVTGVNLTRRSDGGISLSGEIGQLFSIPPPTVDGADGSDLTSESKVRYEVRDPNGSAPGALLTVSIDRDWLRRQGPSVFPLVIDPSYLHASVTSAVSYSNLGDVYVGPSIKIGHDSTGRDWRGAVYFDQYECCFNSNYRVSAGQALLRGSERPP